MAAIFLINFFEDMTDRGTSWQNMTEHRSYTHTVSSCEIKAWKIMS